MKQEIWTNNIKRNLGIFANKEAQRKAWVEGDATLGSMSWYDEMCDLFDSNLFNEYLMASQESLEPKVYEDLLKLRDRLENYEGHEEDSETLKDPEWIEITDLAAQALVHWK